MKEKVEIVSATKEDEPFFIELYKKFQDVNIEMDPKTFKKADSNIELSLLFRKILIDEKFHLYFALLKSIPIGYFLLTVINKKTDILSRAEKYIFVEQIFLIKEYRNKGIAGKMVDKIEKISKYLGIERIEAEILYENKTSLNFIKNLGGKIKSVKVEFDLNGEN